MKRIKDLAYECRDMPMWFASVANGVLYISAWEFAGWLLRHLRWE